MNRYYTGTSAYKLDDYETQARENQRKQQERREALKVQQSIFCRNLVIGVIAVFIAASALVYVNVMALRANSDIADLEKQLAMVIDNNRQKEIEINRKLDMKVIEKKAVDKLGMQKPDNSQIVYVDVRKENKVEVYGSASVADSGIVNTVKAMFTNIWEYFN